MEKSVRGVTSTPQNRRLLWRRRTALTHLRSERSMSRCASCLLRRPNCLQRKKMEGPSARMGARIVMILTSALRCRPLAEVAPVARRHHQSPPTISPLLSACLDSTIDHATQLNLVHLNSPWFFSTQHFNSTWSVSTQHLNSTFQFNLATQRPTTWLNGTAGRTWPSPTVWLGSPAQRHSWRIQHTPQTTTHKPQTTNHNTHTPYTTHHKPQATSSPLPHFPP